MGVTVNSPPHTSKAPAMVSESSWLGGNTLIDVDVAQHGVGLSPGFWLSSSVWAPAPGGQHHGGDRSGGSRGRRPDGGAGGVEQRDTPG